MAGLVLGVVGAAAGSYVGQPALGFAIGSALGQYFFGGANTQDQTETRVGPRLNDLSVQSAAYGTVIPFCYANIRIAGGLIWSTGLIETQHNTSTNLASANQSSGKGGGGNNTQSTISYTYSASFAIGLCAGKIQGVRRLWADSKLIYEANNPFFSDPQWLTVYQGTSTQTADTTIAAAEGGLNVPGFRDMAYMVFSNFQLGDFSNHIPNITAEVVKGNLSCSVVTSLAYDGLWVNVVGGSIIITENGATSNSFVFNSLKTSFQYAMGLATGIAQGAFGLDSLNFGYLTTATQIFKFNIATGATIFVFGVGGVSFAQIVSNGTLVIAAMPSGVGSTCICLLDVNLKQFLPFTIRGASPPNNTLVSSLLAIRPQVNVLLGCQQVTGLNTIYCYSWFEYLPQPGHPTQFQYFLDNQWAINPDTTRSLLKIIWVDPQGCWFALYNNAIYVINAGTGAIQATLSYSGCTDMFFDKSRNIVWLISSTDVYWINAYDLGDTGTITAQLTPYGTSFRYFAMDLQGKLWITGALAGAGVTLVVDFFMAVAEIVTDICERAGLPSNQINTSTLTGICKGYTIPNIMSARAAIAQLSSAFFFDAVESNGQINFIQRGANPIATLNWNNDLAAHKLGDQLPDIITAKRQQDLDLPLTVYVKFFNYMMTYQQGTQYARRLATNANTDATTAFAIAMTDQEAAQIAEILLAVAWWGRETYEFVTGINQVALDPADIVNISLQNGNIIECRILETTFTLPNLITFSAVRDTGDLYLSDADGAPVNFFPPIPPVNSFTVLQLMDIPILRDVDNANGYYAAMCGLNGNSWSGCVVYDSTDGGNTYNKILSNLIAAPIGICSDILGVASTNNIWDLTNTLTVVMTAGVLESVEEIDVYNGLNCALVGGEIIQFMNAILIAPSTYILSRFLRGRRGTEQWISTHQANENFIVLNARSGFFVTSPTSLNNTAVTFVPVSVGSTIETSPHETFVNTASSLKPYSVVHVTGIRDTAGDLTIGWFRRGRVSNNWIDYSDIPLGEQTEQYEIDIYDFFFAGIVRTIIVNPDTDTLPLAIPSVVYTLAEQIQDFGSAQSNVNMIIYQISATVGRGFPNQTTL